MREETQLAARDGDGQRVPRRRGIDRADSQFARARLLQGVRAPGQLADAHTVAGRHLKGRGRGRLQPYADIGLRLARIPGEVPLLLEIAHHIAALHARKEIREEDGLANLDAAYVATIIDGKTAETRIGVFARAEREETHVRRREDRIRRHARAVDGEVAVTGIEIGPRVVVAGRTRVGTDEDT